MVHNPLQIIFDVSYVNHDMKTWINEHKLRPTKPAATQRIFFHPLDKRLALDFLIKFQRNLHKTNLDCFYPGLDEPMVMFLALGEEAS